jgi:hypothetical protein
MYKPKIFLVGEGKDNLIALEETGYVTESTLQEYLADYPDLLPGDQIDPENPRRWLLVAREMGIPGDVAEADRWSLDHLFLDQDGIPTFVECKRAADTRTRREVVAQMLDYAANGIEYWSMDRLRQSAAEAAQRRGKSLDEEIAELLGEEEADIEGYWKRVEDNLHNRRVRLIFATDSTPKELRRLVEFLNKEMTHVEVLAVEIKQFRQADHKGQKAIVPRLVNPPPPEGDGILTREKFLEKCTPEARGFFERVLDRAKERGYTIYWAKTGFSLRAQLWKGGGRASFAYGVLPNIFQFYFESDLMRTDKVLRNKLLNFGVFRESGNWTLEAVLTEENLARMNEVYDFILDQVDELVKAQQ